MKLQIWNWQFACVLHRFLILHRQTAQMRPTWCFARHHLQKSQMLKMTCQEEIISLPIKKGIKKRYFSLEICRQIMHCFLASCSFPGDGTVLWSSNCACHWHKLQPFPLEPDNGSESRWVYFSILVVLGTSLTILAQQAPCLAFGVHFSVRSFLIIQVSPVSQHRSTNAWNRQLCKEKLWYEAVCLKNSGEKLASTAMQEGIRPGWRCLEASRPLQAADHSIHNFVVLRKVGHPSWDFLSFLFRKDIHNNKSCPILPNENAMRKEDSY